MEEYNGRRPWKGDADGERPVRGRGYSGSSRDGSREARPRRSFSDSSDENRGEYRPRRASERGSESRYSSRREFGRGEDRGFRPRRISDSDSEGGYRPRRISDSDSEGGYRPRRISDSDSEGGYRPRSESHGGFRRSSDGGFRPHRISDSDSEGGYRPRRTSDSGSEGDRRPRREFRSESRGGFHRNHEEGSRMGEDSGRRFAKGSDRGPGKEFRPRRDSDRSFGNGSERRSEGGFRPHRDSDSRRDGFGHRGNFSGSGFGRGDRGGRRFSSGDRQYDRPRRNYGDGKFNYKDKEVITPMQQAPERPVIDQPDACPEGLVRLNKFIANSGVCSRREADQYIQTGLVTVNGEIVTELGTKVKYSDDIRFNGERLKGEQKVYILMNKPKDYVTTVSDPHADQTVMDLIPKELCPERVYPVGRLDRSTTGLLMFTNDGELAEKLTHPSFGVKKIYHAFLDKNLSEPDFNAILNGIELEDGEIHADALSYVDGDNSQVGIEIHSGRNRIVRRIFEHLGYGVKKLDRVYFAGLTKKGIRRGEWRYLDGPEVAKLRMGSFE